jgi:muramoyltetrapeptide carboxypeptidase LdcA involved in peptidoglycan recycling
MNLELIIDMFRNMLIFPGRPTPEDTQRAILFLEELKKKETDEDRLLELIQVLDDDDDCILHGLDWVLAEMREILDSDEE